MRRTVLSFAAVLLAAAGLSTVATGSVGTAPVVPAPTAFVAGSAAVTPVNLTAAKAGSAVSIGTGSPTKAAMSPDGATAYITRTDTLVPVSVATNAAGTPIALPHDVRGVAITPNGTTAYVTTATGVTPINLTTNAAGANLGLPGGVSPTAVAITPNGATAYVTSRNADGVYPLDLASQTFGPKIAVDSSPQGIAITPDGSLALATTSNGVTPIVLATNTPAALISVGVVSANSVAITPDGTTAFVAASFGGVFPINITNATAGPAIPIGQFLTDVAIAADGKTAYVTAPQQNALLPIDVATKTVGKAIATPAGAIAVAITPDQAPVAHVSVTPAHAGAATAFDASASTVMFGSIAKYAWSFGDGTTQTTTTPTTTHVYASGGTFPVSVTETSSAGTSTTKVFTGTTMLRNGGPSAVATTSASIPGPLAYTAYVANYADNTVTPINLATHVPGPTIPTPAGPDAIAITPNGKTAYVASDVSKSVTPINTATNTAGPTIPVGGQATALAITPDGKTLWVANNDTGTVQPIATATNTAGAPITIPGGVYQIAITPDGSTLWVLPYLDDFSATPLNLATGVVGQSITNVSRARGPNVFTPDGARMLTPNQSNFVQDRDMATGTNFNEFVLNALAGTLVINPSGTTAYVGYTAAFDGGVVPIDLASRTVGAKIHTTTQGSYATAITPDGATVIVGNNQDHSVTLVDTATNTAGATIQVGNTPFAIAVTPDQAPVARLHVDRAPLGEASTLDASASTVSMGTRASYFWDFGDGTTATTTDPVVQHVYNEGSLTASVTVTSSGGTSNKVIFTGQTVSNNGGPSATATALGSLVGNGPVVNALTPAAGPPAGGTAVTITGQNFTGSTDVAFNGVSAPFTFVNATTIKATAPASAAAVADVVVTTPAGSSAISPADHFTYVATAPPVSCSSVLCTVVVAAPTLPVTMYGSMSNGSCGTCTVTGSASYGALGGACAGLPSVIYEAATTGAPPSSGLSAAVAVVGNVQIVGFTTATQVCAVKTETLGFTATRASAAAAAPKPAKPAKLKKCSTTKPKAPCVLVSGSTTRFLLPANTDYKFQVGPAPMKLSKVSPVAATVGSQLTITGKGLSQVTGVTIGGVQAPIVSQSDKAIVVTVPDGAQTGPVAVIGATGALVTKQVVTIR